MARHIHHNPAIQRLTIGSRSPAAWRE
ncbi:hypothetical protein YPPY64_2859, partial [Yersinia pestis PY-64]